MALVIIVFLYASVKFIHLESHHNPAITNYLESYQTTAENPINMNGSNSILAFAFEGYRDKDLKNDTKFVKWIIRIYGKKNSVEYEHLIPHHVCTEEDYA